MQKEVEHGEVPLQENILTLGMYGDDLDFYILKGVIENLLETINILYYDVEKETQNSSYHPGRCANIKVGIDTIATLGEVNPEVLDNYMISRRTYLAELNITKLVDGTNEALKDVKFAILDEDRNVIETIVTDENGVATTSRLQYGTYYFKEIEAPDGYIMDNNEYKFDIINDCDLIQAVVYNQKKTLPVTGGFISSDIIIIIIVTLGCTVFYILLKMLISYLQNR